MKLTIKTTQQKVFQIDVEPSENIGQLKEKINQAQGHPVASQKVIYSGKILPDDKLIESCGFKEKDFLVLMVSKPKPTPAASTSATPVAAPSTPAPAPAPAPAAPSTPAPAPAPAAAPAPVATSPPAAEVPASAPDAGQSPFSGGSFLSGDAYLSAVNNLVEMGFPRDDVVRAMRASFNNPDRAAEYLMNGVPVDFDEGPPNPAPASSRAAAPAAQPATGAAAAAAPAPAAGNAPQNLFQLAQQQQQHGGAVGGSGPAGAGGALPGGLNLDALRNSPQMLQLRQAIQSNPENAQILLQQLAVQNPGIAQIIAQDPSILANLLGIQFDEEGEDDVPPGANVIHVTPEESAAIERLQALGFPRNAVVEAYFACDKNEELAANYLFENQFGDD